MLTKIETLITESFLNHEIIVSWKVASNFYRLISGGYKEVRPNIALIKTCIIKTFYACKSHSALLLILSPQKIAC